MSDQPIQLKDIPLPTCLPREVAIYADWMNNQIEFVEKFIQSRAEWSTEDRARMYKSLLHDITTLKDMHATMQRRANILFQEARGWTPEARGVCSRQKDKLQAIQVSLVTIQTRAILYLSDQNINSFFFE